MERQNNKNRAVIKQLYIIQIFLLLVGLTMTALGILRGEAMEILRKAIIICLECIGIG